MAYDEEPRPARRGNQPWLWIIIAAVVAVVVLIIIFFFFRPGQEVIAPGNGVEVIDPVDEVDVVDPTDEDADAGVPATVDEGAWVSPGLRYVVINGVEGMAA